MSDIVYLKLRGEGWGVERTPYFGGTKIVESNSGIETRLTSQTQPRWKFGLKYNILKQQDTSYSAYDEIVNLFIGSRGEFDTFLFRDPNNYAIVDGYIATADGEDDVYKISINRKGFQEEVNWVDLNSEISVMIDGVPISTSQYTVYDTGFIVFEFVPTKGATITASFEYLYRVRFARSEQTFKEFLYKLHTSSVSLVSVLGE